MSNPTNANLGVKISDEFKVLAQIGGEYILEHQEPEAFPFVRTQIGEEIILGIRFEQ